jgi:anti-sigma regulatory factor (Ser/Thr protein kinase)
MKRTRSFPREPESVGAARRFATEALTDVCSDVRDSVELMVSELATNCVRHAGTAFDMTVVHAHGEIRIEVTDRGGGTPAMRSVGPDDQTGRGLQIVNMLSDTWGVEHRREAGNTVWFTVATQSAERAQITNSVVAEGPQQRMIRWCS